MAGSQSEVAVVLVEVVISNKLGLHARAAAKFVQISMNYESEIWLTKGSNRVNGKSIMGILTLAAARGERLTIEVNGPDEEEASRALRDLVLAGFGENGK
ncbi:MAG: HPr family phosphocarrier protein [bacterium]|nr:MAG: HPr family phosphocarrier protein [bacterium]